MSRKFVIAGFALLTLLATLGPRLVASDDGKKASPGPAAKFAGKYLAINTRGGEQMGGTPTLKDVELVTLGGRNFLVGEYATDVREAPEAWKGVKVWVPMDEITNILEMSLDQARKIQPVAK